MSFKVFTPKGLVHVYSYVWKSKRWKRVYQYPSQFHWDFR